MYRTDLWEIIQRDNIMRLIVNHSDAIEFENTQGPDHLNTLKSAVNAAKCGEPLRIHTITNWHYGVYKGPQRGQLRTCDVTISGTKYKPPSAFEVPMLLQDHLDRVNRLVMPSWLDIAEMHEEFTAIHPHYDGNGRNSRVELNYMGVRHNLGYVCLRFKDRDLYIDLLQTKDIRGLAQLFANRAYEVF